MSAEPLNSDLVEAIAMRVAELVERPSLRLMTVDEVAEMLRVRPEWVYENADYLGVMRLGAGEKGRLRFDRQRVLERIEAPRPKPRRRRAPRPRASGRVELLRVGPKQC